MYLFTMDVTSLYTCIPHADWLTALKHFLNKRESLHPPTETDPFGRTGIKQEHFLSVIFSNEP